MTIGDISQCRMSDPVDRQFVAPAPIRLGGGPGLREDPHRLDLRRVHH